jgi:hypothetical protein
MQSASSKDNLGLNDTNIRSNINEQDELIDEKRGGLDLRRFLRVREMELS